MDHIEEVCCRERVSLLRNFHPRGGSSRPYAELRGEVALCGLAAAAENYYELPHDAETISHSRITRQATWTSFSKSETQNSENGLCKTRTVSAPTDVPPLVTRALELSRREGFITATRHETGRLLATLAAACTGTLAELGTGCGVGSAWLRSGIGDNARVVTAELNPELAEKVQEIYADTPEIQVLAGDWTTLEQYAPFSLLFVDVRDVKRSVEAVCDLMEPGGIVILDDFTPCDSWPPIFEGRVDVMREQWLSDSRFTAVEVMVAADSSVLIATRR